MSPPAQPSSACEEITYQVQHTCRLKSLKVFKAPRFRRGGLGGSWGELPAGAWCAWGHVSAVDGESRQPGLRVPGATCLLRMGRAAGQGSVRLGPRVCCGWGELLAGAPCAWGHVSAEDEQAPSAGTQGGCRVSFAP